MNGPLPQGRPVLHFGLPTSYAGLRVLAHLTICEAIAP